MCVLPGRDGGGEHGRVGEGREGRATPFRPVHHPPPSSTCSPSSHIRQPARHRAETLMMLMPAELAAGSAGCLLWGGLRRLSLSGVRSGGLGRLMIAVVIRPPLLLSRPLSSALRLRFERLEVKWAELSNTVFLYCSNVRDHSIYTADCCTICFLFCCIICNVSFIAVCCGFNALIYTVKCF